MPKIYTINQLQILMDNFDNFASADISEIIYCFPFNDMTSMDILDRQLVRKHLEFLEKLSNSNNFFEDNNAALATSRFLISMFFSLESIEDEQILLQLLNLFHKIISRAKDVSILDHIIKSEIQHWYQALFLIIESKIFSRIHVPDYTKIIYVLYDVNEDTRSEAPQLLFKTLDIFKKMNTIHEIAVICNFVIERLTGPENLIDNCISLLLSTELDFFNEPNVPEETTILLMNGISQAYVIVAKLKKTASNEKVALINILNKFVNALLGRLDFLIQLYTRSNSTMKSVYMKLLAIALSDCISTNFKFVYKQLCTLPQAVEMWPRAQSTVVFYICRMFYTYSRPLWPSDDIIKSMNSFIYSEYKFMTSDKLLETLLFVYPIVLPTCHTKSNILLGDELLHILKARFDTALLTTNGIQLVWILLRGDLSLKKKTVRYWLKSGDVYILYKVMKQNVGMILVDILIEETDQVVIDNCLDVIRVIDNRRISMTFCKLLPVFYDRPKIFARILKTNHKLSHESHDAGVAKEFCRFLSLIPVFIRDEDVLKDICRLCNKIIMTFNENKDVVDIFYRHSSNIKFLLIKCEYVEDDTAKEILEFLKNLLLIQQQNQTPVEELIGINANNLFSGNPEKRMECLDIIYLILSSNNSFLKIADDLNFNILFLKLTDTTREPDLAKKSFYCMSILLKRYPSLAYKTTTQLFIYYNCSVDTHKESCWDFVEFIGTWSEIIKQTENDKMKIIIDVGSIENYLGRLKIESTEAELACRFQICYLLENLRSTKMSFIF